METPLKLAAEWQRLDFAGSFCCHKVVIEYTEKEQALRVELEQKADQLRLSMRPAGGKQTKS
jgi:hypothetical protein